jgi:hypothetical protein
MTRLIVVSSAVAWSCAAVANPIPTSKTVVELEYWGTITSVSDAPVPKDEFEVGDAIHGFFHIDTSLAPADFDPKEAGEGQYIWNGLCDRLCPPRIPAPSGFVTSDKTNVQGDSDDWVSVIDQSFGELYSVVDRETTASRIWQASVSVYQHRDYLHGDGLVQTFDIVPVDDVLGNPGASGEIREVTAATSRLVHFAVSRIRATPKVCRP